MSLRERRRIWILPPLLLGIVLGLYVFQFFSGYPILRGLTVPVDVAIAGLDSLGAAPIITTPNGQPPLNATWTTSTFYTDRPLVSYEWWYQFPNSTSHRSNLWEPVYAFWDVSTPGSARLLSIYTRFHFVWRQVTGPYQVTGSAVRIRFSNVFYIPYVNPGAFLGIVLGTANPGIPLYTFVRSDAGPPTTGPNAAEAGPIDPWYLLGSGLTIQNGILYGSGAGLGLFAASYAFISLVVHPERHRIRKELLDLALDLG